MSARLPTRRRLAPASSFTPLLASALLAIAAVAFGAAVTLACGRTHRQRVASFVPPPMPAGFVAHSGAGWRAAAPSTWKDAAQKGPALWAVADPQSVDDFHANVSVSTEPFGGESYDYASASETALRKEQGVNVESSREDTIDGDPTWIVESRWPPSPPATVGYRSMQTALASRGQGYVITCSVSLGAFERYRSTCESILHQFAVER